MRNRRKRIKRNRAQEKEKVEEEKVLFATNTEGGTVKKELKKIEHKKKERWRRKRYLLMSYIGMLVPDPTVHCRDTLRVEIWRHNPYCMYTDTSPRDVCYIPPPGDREIGC
jgi:hypothetical protein